MVNLRLQKRCAISDTPSPSHGPPYTSLQLAGQAVTGKPVAGESALHRSWVGSILTKQGPRTSYGTQVGYLHHWLTIPEWAESEVGTSNLWAVAHPTRYFGRRGCVFEAGIDGMIKPCGRGLRVAATRRTSAMHRWRPFFGRAEWPILQPASHSLSLLLPLLLLLTSPDAPRCLYWWDSWDICIKLDVNTR